MALLTKAIATVLSKHLVAGVLGKGLDADLVNAGLSWSITKITAPKNNALKEGAASLANQVAEELETFLKLEGAADDQIVRLSKAVARSLEKAGPAATVINAVYDEDAIKKTILDGLENFAVDPNEMGYAARIAASLSNKLARIATDLSGYSELSEKKKLRAFFEIQKTLEEMKSQLQNTFSKDDVEWRDYAEKYLQSMRRELNFVEILGLGDVTRGERESELSVAYLSLNLGDGDDAEDGSIDFRSLLKRVVSEQQSILIEGGAGSGKSTLLRWGCCGASDLGDVSKWRKSTIGEGKTAPELWGNQEKFSEEKLLDVAAPPIPFLIRLRQFPRGDLPPMQGWPRLICPGLDEPPVGFASRAIALQRAIIMFDGVDEIPEGDARNKALQTIASYAKEHEHIPIIVASRPGAFNPKEIHGLEKLALHSVNDLSVAQQSRFITNWHKARALSKTASPTEDYEKLSSTLQDRIKDTPSLARIATNPLLCAATCALHERQRETLPSDERGLCDKLTMMLLARDRMAGRTDAVKLNEFPAEYDLREDDRRQLLAHLAAKMVRWGTSQLDWDEAVSLTKKGLKELGDNDRLEPQTMLHALAKRSPPLRDCTGSDGGEGVEFLHNRFKEYLASVWFLSEDEYADLVNHAEKEDYAEALVMAAAAPDRRKYAENLVSGIMDRAEEVATPKLKRTMRVLALRAALAAPALPENLRVRATSLQGKLLPPRSMAEASALAGAGDAVVQRLKQKTKLRNAAESTRCIRCLSLIGTTKARTALSSYFDDTRQSVLNELLRSTDASNLSALWVPDEGGVVKIPSSSTLMRLPQELHAETVELQLQRSAVSDISPIERLSGLHSLNVAQTSVDDLDPLSSSSTLEKISLMDTAVSDISPLENHRNLRLLNICGTKVSDLSPISELTNLEELLLSDCEVINLEPLANLTGLTRLELTATKVKDLSPLVELKKLQTLYINQISSVDLSPLTSLKDLHDLELHDVQPRDFSFLIGLTELRRLNLRKSGFSDCSILTDMRFLEKLGLESTDVADLTPISHLPNIRELYIGHTKVSDLKPLVGFSKLESLFMPQTKVKNFKPLEKLSSLNLLDVAGIDETDYNELKGRFPQHRFYR